MIAYLSSYLQPIAMACMLFPLIAGVFTIPFVIRQYRKFGGIALMRVIVVYSFILYAMCAFLLTVLPLPSIEEVLKMPDHPIGWIPYVGFRHGLAESGFSVTDPASWKRFLTCDDFLQVFYNVVMTIPLGVYMRYYFKLSWKKTILVGFCTSFFYEATQYSGLYGIYPKAYRYTEMDDLINNTLGALIGFWIEPLFARFLPAREEIDRISYRKGEHVTFMRRVFAVVIDYVISNIIFALTEAIFIPVNAVKISTSITVWAIEMFIYFIILPVILGARTPGQALLKLKLVREDGRRVRWHQVVLRNILLYVVEFVLINISGSLLSAFVMSLLTWDNSFFVMLVFGLFCGGSILVMLFFMLRCLKKYNMMPHSRYSHTLEVAEK